MNASLDKMILSLEGLSTGDAFGELFFSLMPARVPAGDLLDGPWRWTDDTQMALSICEVLKRRGAIDQDELAASFTRRYLESPYRGYGGGARALLQRIAAGDNWREASRRLFDGGSYGNGAAMRVAPIGGYFYGEPAKAALEARLSAEVTHAHPEGQAGAMAVAAAAAIAATEKPPAGLEFLTSVLQFIPPGITHERTRMALDITDRQEAASRLGTGYQVSAQDTVPFCLWSAAYHLYDYETALWNTVLGLGDRDTTCAIVGGIVALSARKIPSVWLERRELLPTDFLI